MNIQIKDYVGFSEEVTVSLAMNLLQNRKPKNSSYDYGLETYGVFGITLGVKLDYPIQVYQSNKRKNNKSPIIITIERHTPIL